MAHQRVRAGVHDAVVFLARDRARPQAPEVEPRPPSKQDARKREPGQGIAARIADIPELSLASSFAPPMASAGSRPREWRCGKPARPPSCRAFACGPTRARPPSNSAAKPIQMIANAWLGPTGIVLTAYREPAAPSARPLARRRVSLKASGWARWPLKSRTGLIFRSIGGHRIKHRSAPPLAR